MSDCLETLRPTLSLEQASQLDAVCDAFEQAWKQNGGSQPSISAYLEQLPASLHELAVLELLPIEIEYLRLQGAMIPLDEYSQRYPFARKHLDEWMGHCSLPQAHTRLSAGDRLGKYTIVRWLAAGGMGEVYRAVDSTLGRDVAIKVLHSRYARNAEALARIKVEAHALAALNHPHIVTVHELDQRDGLAYIVLELLDGETLAERLQRSPLAPSEVFDLAGQLAAALAAAHAKKIIHRDLKPRNIMLTKDGQVKILDFGLARLLEQPAALAPQPTTSPADNGQTRAGARLGTAGYMSPEQVRGQAVDARSDIFSFGCVLYEMATGTPAFVRPTVEESDRAVKEEPAPVLPKGPLSDLGPIVSRCLQKPPQRRYASAADLAEDLARVSISQQQRSVRTARRWERAAIVLLSVLLLMLGAWIVHSVVVAWRMRVIVAAMNELSSTEPCDVEQLAIHAHEFNETARSAGFPADAKALIRGENGPIVSGFLFLESGTKENFDDAIRQFQSVIGTDSEPPVAHVGLALCYYRMSSVYMNPKDAMEKVRSHALRAIELDKSNQAPSSALAHALLALFEHRYAWNWGKANSHFDAAHSIKKVSLIARRFYANSLVLQDHATQGVSELESLRSRDDQSAELTVDLALACLYAGDDGHAEKYAEEVLRVDSQYFPAHWALGEVFLWRKKYGEAIKHLRLAHALDPESPEVLAELAFCLGRSSKPNTKDWGEALSIIAELKQRVEAAGGFSSERYVPYTALAVAQLGVGETGSAVKNLENGFQQKDEWLVWLKIDPVFEDLREKTDFIEIFNKIGLWPTIQVQPANSGPPASDNEPPAGGLSGR